jgi:hypothetical protein
MITTYKFIISVEACFASKNVVKKKYAISTKSPLRSNR